MYLPIISEVFGTIRTLGSELIEDKDKRNEFNVRLAEMQGKLDLAIVQMKTHPTVDAIVKLMYASIVFFRPIGSAALSAFGSYLAYLEATKGITVNPAITGGLISAFPGWMWSRHKKKMMGGI